MSKEPFGRDPLQEHNANERLVRWGITGNSFNDYLNDFYRIDEKAQIPRQLEWLKAQSLPIIIDFMATTHAVASLMNFLEKPYKALAVSYSEKGEPKIKPNGVTHLTGDLNSSKTWTGVSDWLGTQKAHLIMARPFGGLHHIPTRSSFYRCVAARSWAMLDPDGGTLLCQIPPLSVLEKRHINMTHWIERLRNQKIDFQYLPTYESRDACTPYGLFMAIKHSKDQYLPE